MPGSVTMQNLYFRLAPFLLALIEALLLAATGALILFASRRSSHRNPPSAFRWIESTGARLARRRCLSVLLVGLSVVGVRIALIPIL
ncbi:MAG: hypothetical protein WAN41_10330, partial [Candidatus Sulfotelmatobacter sp.]